MYLGDTRFENLCTYNCMYAYKNKVAKIIVSLRL